VTCGMDRLEAHERLLAILRAAIGGTYRQNRSPARRSTGRAHLAIVGETRAELVRRMADPITLADLARSVHVSPYHLARVFRQETGRSIHELLRELRLRTALERLDGERRLNVGTVAAEVGFAGHSHFTAAFREAFGTPPSQFRSAVQGRSATISPSRDIA
jgi:transcriptional regulator GlxA family with amidase domain